MNDSAVKTVTALSFEDYGVDSPSYFPGAGVAYTDWDEVFVGVGDTAKEAAEDALEVFYQTNDRQSDDIAETLQAGVSDLDDTESAHADCDLTCERSDEDCTCHDECELSHYVALFVKYTED